MKAHLDLGSVVEPSPDIVARDIEGEIVIIPLVAGIGDADDELYTLNAVGRDVWRLLDGSRTLGDIVSHLGEVYEATADEIEADVVGFATELCQRRMLTIKD